MSSHFNQNSTESIDNFLQPPYDYATDDHATVQGDEQYHQTSLQLDADEYVRPNDSMLTPQVSIPRISKTFDSERNQILKIELEIVIKLKSGQNDQNQQYDRSSTLLKNRTANRMHPYRKLTEQNFRNENRNDARSYFSASVPRLNRSSAQFQQNEGLNESFNSNYDNDNF
jgi:hypothetical protein